MRPLSGTERCTQLTKRRSAALAAIAALLITSEGQANEEMLDNASPPALAAAGKDFVDLDRVTNIEARSRAVNYIYFVLGSFDVYLNEKKLCQPPGGVTPAQIGAVVSKYLNDHPERWNLSPVRLIHEALAPVFPCHPTAGKQ